ncbi:MAG: HAMP domain-containing histidine kinase [Spirochaetales bacterium]|nr:HAMP domain-containing histidine kinase [Spirochaetales bacterium]
METWFAPAERLSNDEWSQQTRLLTENALVKILLASVGGYLVILNSQRQAVSANVEFLRMLGIPSLAAFPGQRFGELLRCQNSDLMPGGCGTSPGCANCGALLATLESISTSSSVTSECRICRFEHGVHRTLDYRLKVSPLPVGNEMFTALIFWDISQDKRRESMEQVFLHDVRNLLGGLSGLGELLTLKSGDETAGLMVRLSRLLNRELDAQNLLRRAENGDFLVDLKPILVRDLLADLESIFAEHPCATGNMLCPLVVGPEVVHSDPGVLTRILVNMLKNAFEASTAGQTVILSLEPEEGGLFVVHNEGVIPADVAVHVFEKSFSTTGEAGRGWGTYSLRLWAEGFLKAKVWFTSDPGRGTSFYLKLPSVQSPSLPQSDNGSSEPQV